MLSWSWCFTAIVTLTKMPYFRYSCFFFLLNSPVFFHSTFLPDLLSLISFCPPVTLDSFLKSILRKVDSFMRLYPDFCFSFDQQSGWIWKLVVIFLFYLQGCGSLVFWHLVFERSVMPSCISIFVFDAFVLLKTQCYLPVIYWGMPLVHLSAK